MPSSVANSSEPPTVMAPSGLAALGSMTLTIPVWLITSTRPVAAS